MDRKRIAVMTLVLLGLSTGSPVYGDEVSGAGAALDGWAESFGIERPWDDLPGVSDRSQRQRGALAYVYHRSKSGEVPGEARANLYRDLGRLSGLKADRVLESQPAFGGYQEFFEVDVFSLWKQLITGAEVPVRWGATFKEAYYSQADGAGVLFEVRMPPAVEGRETYPMFVVLKGGPRVDPDDRFPFIQVKPSRGGIWGYRAISGYDVMRVIGFMKRYYPVDPDRVYLVGSSAGASGAMHLASCYPDEFAAVLPLVAVGTDFPLVNFKNLPVEIHHGTEDWISSICNARVQYEKMRELGCPVVLKEYPGIGHSVPKPHEPLVGWLLEHRRNRSPLSVAHECETPTLGRSYWIHIREFQNPHQRASVEASVDFSDGTVRVRPENVQAFTLEPGLMPGGASGIATVEVGGDRLPLATKRFDCRFQDGRWHVVSGEGSADPPRRPYRAGAAANLYQGEPLLVVYGAGSGRAGRAGLLRSAAQKLAGYGGPVFSPMQGRFPVVADTDLSPEQEANCNLILIGTPGENRVTGAVLPGLPISVRNDTLVAADRPNLGLENRVLSLLYPHPKYPKRLVYLIVPFTDAEGLARFCEAPQGFLAGSDGFDRVSQADLVVQDLDHRIGRQMQFGKEWEWIAQPGADRPLPDRFRDRANLALTYLEIMRRKSGADFAFWWGPADEGMWGHDFNFLKRYDPGSCTEADFRAQHRFIETMTGGVSGVEVKEIWNRWGQNKQLLSVPEVQVDAVADQEQYRVHIPMDLYIKLGQRRKALDDPKPGPAISSEEVVAEIFR